MSCAIHSFPCWRRRRSPSGSLLAVRPRRRPKASWPRARVNGRRPRRRERPVARHGRSFWRNAERARPARRLRPPGHLLPRLPRPLRPPRPRSQAPCSRGGSSPRLRLPRRRRTSARPRPRGLANTRPNWRRAPAARPTRSCGSTRRRASTTTRGPTIMGIPSGARTCARPTRERLEIARRERSFRPRPIRDKGRRTQTRALQRKAPSEGGCSERGLGDASVVVRQHYRAAPQRLLPGRRGWPASIDRGRTRVLLRAAKFLLSPATCERSPSKAQLYPGARSRVSLRARDGERPVQRLNA